MTRPRDKISHLVKVARIRIETTVVEVEGDDIDDDEAALEAIEAAELMPDEMWVTQPFDAAAYRPHVQTLCIGPHRKANPGGGASAGLS